MTQKLLISIHPRHSGFIFSGSKFWEFRRLAPRRFGETAFTAWVYETAPTKKVVGEFVGAVHVYRTFDDLRIATGGGHPMSRAELAEYYGGGNPEFCAIHILDAMRWAQPKQLQDVCKLKHPPQSFAYIDG